MAISKNRLEELIKQSATIYWLAGEMVLNIHLDSSYYVSDANILCHKRSEDEKNCVEHIENLYETQKQAEWHLKYHATRTEELNLPTWEEFDKNNKTICFTAKDWQCYELGFAFGDTETICLDKIVLGVNINQKTWKATEENYIKACDLCLKLFKVEEE